MVLAARSERDGWRVGWKPAIQQIAILRYGRSAKEKSGRGLPQSKTLARGSEAPRNGEAFGVRQSSAALRATCEILISMAVGARLGLTKPEKSLTIGEAERASIKIV